MNAAPRNRPDRASRQGLSAMNECQSGRFPIQILPDTLPITQPGRAQKIATLGHGGSVFGVFLQLR